MLVWTRMIVCSQWLWGSGMNHSPLGLYVPFWGSEAASIMPWSLILMRRHFLSQGLHSAFVLSSYRVLNCCIPGRAISLLTRRGLEAAVVQILGNPYLKSSIRAPCSCSRINVCIVEMQRSGIPERSCYRRFQAFSLSINADSEVKLPMGRKWNQIML